MRSGYLREPESRPIVRQLVRLRIEALLWGDDVPNLLLTLHYLGWAFVLALPPETTTGRSWRMIRPWLHGDLGAAIVAAVVGLTLIPGTLLPTWSPVAKMRALLLALVVSVGLSLSMLLSYPAGPGWVDSALCALIAWLAFLRTDRD